MARIAQYEMAYRMQLEASDAMDITREPAPVLARYGAEPGKTSFANNCLVARRLAERGVRFIQLYHWGWDSHGTPVDQGLNVGLVDCCHATDQPTAALLSDLKERGLLDDTLIVWGGEFGRTPMQENRGGQEMKYIGRDHHPEAFSIWLAGGGIKRGISHGATDDLGYDIVRDPVGSARPARHHALSAGLRLPHLQLSLSGPRPEAHRGQAGARGFGNPGISV